MQVRESVVPRVAATLRQLSRLRFIAVLATGYNVVDVAAALGESDVELTVEDPERQAAATVWVEEVDGATVPRGEGSA